MAVVAVSKMAEVVVLVVIWDPVDVDVICKEEELLLLIDDELVAVATLSTSWYVPIRTVVVVLILMSTLDEPTPIDVDVQATLVVPPYEHRTLK